MPDNKFMRIGGAVLLSMSLFGGGWAGISTASEQVIQHHDARYVRQVDLRNQHKVLLAEVQRERRADDFAKVSSQVMFLEAAIVIKRAQKKDTTLEVLTLKQANREYDRLKGQLNPTGI